MFECGQEYPEYNATCERNKGVKWRSTDHEGTENFKSKWKKQQRDILFVIKAETDVCRTQNKRMALASQIRPQDGEHNTNTVRNSGDSENSAVFHSGPSQCTTELVTFGVPLVFLSRL